MRRAFILAVLAVPVVEIATFLWVASLIGFLPALALMVLTTLLGAALLRRAGDSGLAQLRANARGETQFSGTFSQILATAAAGILLVIPGFVTDLLGILVLIPAVRGALAPLFKGFIAHREDISVINLERTEWRQVPDPDLPPPRRREPGPP